MEIGFSQERVLGNTNLPSEYIQEQKLRPRNFSEYIGQKNILDNIKIMVESAKIRKEAMDHMLLYGPPGLGKTSLAMITAQTLESELHVVSGPSVEKKGDLASLLTNLNHRDVLFIDEIHRMNISVEEILYSAMEDFRLDIVIGQGISARTMQIDIAPFTLVGATTRSGLLSRPLRDRFLAHFHFDFYTHPELAQIVENNAKKMNILLENNARDMMARCSRGTPRLVNRILRRVRDFVITQGKSTICSEQLKNSLNLMEIDLLGLDRMDRKILSIIQNFYKGGPVGIEALCATLGEDRLTVEDVYEPYLLKEGFLLRTPRGREISDKASRHLSKYNFNQTQ